MGEPQVMMVILDKRRSIFKTKSEIFQFCIMIILLFLGMQASGQQKVLLNIGYSDQKKLAVSQRIDSTEINKRLNEHLQGLIASGFNATHVDTMYISKDTCHAILFKGKAYKIGNILLTPEQKAILEDSGIRREKMTGKVLDSITIFSFLKTLVKHQNDNGYPFAMAKLDSVNWDGEKIDAVLRIVKGKFIVFDTIIQDGRLLMGSKFMSRFLEIRKSDPYAQDKVNKTRLRLNNLQYASQREAPYVRFVNDKASLVITMDPRPSSRFDFLIGVLPQIKDGVRKWNITGDFTAELNNTFKYGEYSYFQFKRLKAENVELQIKSTIPYIFGGPIGSHLDFRLFKNGTQNLDLYFDGGIQYQFGGFNQIKLFSSYRASSLLDVNISDIISAGRLPDKLDITYNGIGLGLNLRQLDYRFNPTKGYSCEINTIIGYKKIKPNRQILEEEGFKNSYDTLQLKTVQAELEANLAYFFPVKNWATFKLGATAGLKYNQQKLLQNELIRIGGNRLLRGFDEETILTDFYTFGTAEFRIVFDKNSYISLPFADYGIVNITESGMKKSVPVLGVGMGLNFGTPAGIFNLSFAAGKMADSSLDFGKMKIHFGYVNLF